MSKVLVIDDEALLRDSVAAYLEDDGHQVLVKSNAESGLAQLARFQPDIVIVDLRLEGASGEDFITAAKKLYPSAHYLIHTGCKDYRLTNALRALGISETQVLYKPIGDLSKLSHLIDSIPVKPSTVTLQI